MKQEAYIHGYTPEEQKRLVDQAKILAPQVFEGVDFSKASKILEVGCGVGAQTRILLENFPNIQISAVDKSEAQINQAKHYFAIQPTKARVQFICTDASQLPFSENEFDGGFICWLLEHVSDPIAVLKEVHRCLAPKKSIHLNEVSNQIFYAGPKNKAFTKYWYELNKLQQEVSGHPYIGASLGYFLKQAGFEKIQTKVAYIHCDNRDPKHRTRLLEYFKNLLMSVAPTLLEQKRVDQQLIEDVKKELAAIATEEDGVMLGGWIKAKAVSRTT